MTDCAPLWATVTCPVCNARPGNHCRTGSRLLPMPEPHPARYDMLQHPWPCHRRTAHGPHTITVSTNPPTHSRAYPCPGVRAHPNTMIGRTPQSASTTPTQA